MFAAVLVAAFVVQSLVASLQKSPVFDEPPHIASGLSYVEKHVFYANPQHPPLLKEMSALFLMMAGIHWPHTPDADLAIRGGPASEKMEWPIGTEIIAANGADRTMFWARLPFILLAGLLGALIYWWGRELVGSAAALGALFLYALDPTIIAHSALVTTDVGLAAFTVIFLFSLWRYLQDPGWRRMLWCALALGAVLSTKFSAVFLLPIAAILLLAATRWPMVQSAGKSPDSAQREVKVGPNSPCPCGSGKKYKKCHGAGRPAKAGAAPLSRGKLFDYAMAFAGMCAIAVVVIEALYFFPGDPLLYVSGLKKVNADHLAGYNAYFHGELAKRFSGYFFWVYLLKEPLASIILACTGLLVLLRSKSTPVLNKWFLMLPPVVFVGAVSLLADDLGIRYIIPALPFAYLLGGLALTTLLDKKLAWGKYVAGVLCLWMIVEAGAIYPDHLSYFNETACLLESPGKIGWDGGTRCGPLWLDDSNVDWGQGLKELRTWLAKHANGRSLRLAYFGIFPPEYYGLRFEKVEPGGLLNDPTPGLYAVSAQMVARIPTVGAAASPPAGAWLRNLTPVAIVGHAFYIYDVH